MTKLIDVTHTVKASAAPSAGARYMLDTATNERFWVEQGTVPEAEVPPAPSIDLETLLLEGEEVPEVPPEPEEAKPVPMPAPPKSKKLHHG